MFLLENRVAYYKRTSLYFMFPCHIYKYSDLLAIKSCEDSGTCFEEERQNTRQDE